jgi:hypothetical protein
MKKALFLLALPILFSCNSNQPKVESNAEFIGEKFDDAAPITMAELNEKMKAGGPIEATVTAPITAVCQVKGCWMTLQNLGGEDVRITFKDYAFFVPKDCKGKTAIIHGTASMDTTSVEELKHFAEDDGKAKEEIEKITEPKIEMVFEASGVKLK